MTETLRPGMPLHPAPRRPVIGDRKYVEGVVGEELPAELFTIVPWGHRIVVVREKPIERTAAGIHVPDTAKRKVDTGWVVSIGDRVGDPDGFASTYPCVSPFAPPTELIGRRITFGKYAGVELFPKEETVGGVTYGSRYVCITDGDVLYHHEPLPEGAEEESQ